MAQGERDLLSGGAACFAATSRHELTAGGNKLIGSAQCRRNGVVLQHGSLPLMDETDKFFNLLRFNNQKKRELALDLYRKKATSLDRIIDSNISFNDLSTALTDGICAYFNIETFEDDLSYAELEQLERLRLEKYHSLEWTLHGEKRK